MDLYVVLGLRQDASESEIKRAYRRLARRFHPDINPGDHAAAERASSRSLEAYETLIDRERRLRYDSGEQRADRVEARRRRLRGVRLLRRAARTTAATFGDLFAEVLLEQRRASGRPHAGPICTSTLQLSFDEALPRRRARRCTVTRRETCRVCGGSGRGAHGAERVRALCQGLGAVRIRARAHGVLAKLYRRAAAPGGSGRARARRATAPGTKRGPRRVTVRVPAGIADGDAGARGGKGQRRPAWRSAGRSATSPCTWRRTPQFRREGDDLHLVVPMAIHEAALGARIDIAGARRARCACGSRRARSRASGSGSASAAWRRRAAADAAISSWRSA